MATKPKVLLLKASEESSRDLFQEKLETAGYQTTVINTSVFSFINSEDLLCEMQHEDVYAGIILTSPRAVEAIKILLVPEYDELRSLWGKKEVFVVGKRTKKDAGDYLQWPDSLGEECGSAEALSDFIIKHCPVRKRKYLFPCSKLAGETLIQKLMGAGIDVKIIHIYDTVADPHLAQSLAIYLQDYGVPEYVIFFSPSGVKSVLSALSNNLDGFLKSKVIGIGPTTSRALLEKGLGDGGHPKSPTPESILDYLRSKA